MDRLRPRARRPAGRSTSSTTTSSRSAALVGERPSVIRRLLDAVLASPEAAVARSLSCFVYPNGRGTVSALERQRFTLRESLYLTRHRRAGEPGPANELVRAGRAPTSPAPSACSAAPITASPARECFAADHSREQWARYTWQILRTPGCGRFDADLSRVVCAPGSQTPAAVALVTRIAPDAVHVAQIAVAPELRRQGVGARPDGIGRPRLRARRRDHAHADGRRCERTRDRSLRASRLRAAHQAMLSTGAARLEIASRREDGRCL